MPLAALLRHLALAGMRRRRAARARAARLDGFYPGRPLLLGHRGARTRAPENTIEAALLALELGADGVEIDVQLSRDGVPVVMHDLSVDRTTNGRGAVSTLSAAELGALVCTDPPLAARAFGARVPRLAALLDALPDGAFCNVELKGPVPRKQGLEAATLAVMRPHVGRLRFVVSSFHPSSLGEVRRHAPMMPLGVLIEPAQILPLRAALAAPLLGAEALHPPSALVSEALVRRAHQAGMRVHVWGVRDRRDANWLLECGVDALIVDDVRAAAMLFRERWPGSAF